MTLTRIALFGGTFDPIHLGHIGVASAAVELIGTEKLIFIPAKCSPLKSILPLADDEHRLAMISLAIVGQNNFEVSDYELKNSAPSYTLQTVMHFKKEYGNSVIIHWLVGADTIDELFRWYKITELMDQCNVSVMYRAGCKKPDFSPYEAIWGQKRIEKLRSNVLRTPEINISSTELRRKILAGRDVTDLLHPDVMDYIFTHGLYK